MSTPETKAPGPAEQAIQVNVPAPPTPSGDGVHQPAPPPAVAPPPARPPARKRRWWLWILGGVALAAVLIVGVPWIIKTFTTVSTDDAYVNGHVTFVAPRVPGQVLIVMVDDNQRVHEGDLLVQLDTEPYKVQVKIARAAVKAARADLVTAQAQARGIQGKMRSLRFNLQHAVEDVNNQVAILAARVATLRLQRASLTKAQADYDRAKQLVNMGAVSPEEYDLKKEAFLVAEARVEEALQGVYQVRVALGLPPRPERGDNLAQVPKDLDQNFSSVKQAQMRLLEAAAEIGVIDSFNKTPKQMVDDFLRRDPKGDIDRIYAKLLEEAPAIKQAEAKLAQAERNLEQARLNLSYCDVVAEIDGVVTRRNVNPGNNVVVGQSLMAVRSLTEIWVDANFKETQLARLRIGQPVDLEVDMYGSRQEFKGRISGFTMGTGSTLALLPAENATGNFVKVVQRVPVRIEILNYNPDKTKTPLFIGLSVTPTVYVNEKPTGPNAGKLLQR
jgi:membrane fusion protein (multidrug efflux system)